nr:MAG TPA: Tail tape measure [Caudoviricetes sp.]
MANENIKIVISESGSRVVIRNIRDIADSAERAGRSADRMNGSLGRSNNHNFGKLRSEFGKLDSALTRTVHKIRGIMTLFAAFAGTTISTGAIVKAMDSYTNLQNRLRLVADSQAQVNALTEEMFNIANRSRASVEDTAIAFSRFDLALKSVGRGQKDTLMVTETVNKMIAMTSKGSQEAAASLLQLSQAFSKGKLDGDEFRTVSETMPLLMDAIVKKMGVTRGELLELRKQGKITLDVMIEALREAQPEVDKAFASLPLRVSDALVIVKNNWIKFWGELNTRLDFSPKVAKALVWLSENFKTLAAVGVAAITAISIAMTAKLIPAVVKTYAAIMLNPMAFFLTASIAAIIGVITYLNLYEDELRNSQSTAAQVGVFILDLMDAIKAGWGLIYDTVVDILSAITGKTETEAGKCTSIFQTFFGTTNDGFWGMLEVAAKIIDMITTTVMAAFEYITHNIGVYWDNMFTWITNKAKAFAGWFNSTFGGAMEYVNVTNPLANVNTTPEQLRDTKSFQDAVLQSMTTISEDAVKNAAAARKEARIAEKNQRDTYQTLQDLLRKDNPEIAKKIADMNRQTEAKKAAKGGRVGKSESQTFAEKTAEFAEKNARALDKYTGDCAKYINRAVEAFAKNYKRAGSGINVARNAVATGKYKWVKFDENYTPQVGDIQSMTSWTKLGRIHGHSSMFTKSGWVSDAKQKTYGDGRIGAASYDQYNKLKNGIGQLMIARPIDSKVDNRTYNKIYEKQEKALEKQIDYYNQIIEKTEKEIQSLTLVGNARLADMKTMEMMDSLKQHDVDLTTEQVAKVAELALKYEEAKVAQELREVAEGREKELAHLRAITIEEKAIAAFNDYIASKRKEGIFYTDEQLAKLREESIEHAKILELEQAKLNVHKSQVAEVEKLRMEQQAIMEMMASGEIGGQYAGRKMLANQTAIGRANQAQGLTADGSPMGNSWEEVFGAIMLGKDQLLEGYTGTLNDLTDQFGTFFTNIQDGFADSIGKAIVQGDNLGESLKNAAKQGLQSLISGLVKLGTQWVITQLLMSTTSKSAGTAATTQGTAQAASLTSAYAPAATLANTATFGSASAAGMAGMMAVVALAAALPAMLGKGFMTGGYTGSMATDQIAGVVHGQEYVFDADATRRIGVHNLEALRNGNLSLPATSSKGGTSGSGVNITIQNYASGVTHEVEQIDEENIRIIARQEAQAVVSRQAGRVVAGELANPNSPVSKAMSNNIQAKRKTS